jgi:hypothetical protein
MNHLKKFEGFTNSNPLPTTSISCLTNYYSCDECDALWKSFNKTYNKCKFCYSDEIEDMPKDEWYELVKQRLEPDEAEDLEKQRIKEDETLVDLRKLNRKNAN